MLNCQHHISWVRQVDGGLHQCILCTAVVTKKDVYPKLEDLPEEFQKRWDAHEATRSAATTREASAARPPEPKAPTATQISTATPTTSAPSPRPSPPLRAGEGGAVYRGADPHPGS